MTDDENKLLQIHRKIKYHGYGDYQVEIREHKKKLLVTIKAGKNYRFEVLQDLEE